ncbi:hypothetical protein EZV62_010535 [Acer yangbiense]|uniref:Peroxidase n=1 Tax=Acer yangbiense TaxID=1000413 RepID=A0A5C7I2S2_9ROSI|nr:hypothetical protein EZV62_010535 [Acer yangbiense]
MKIKSSSEFVLLAFLVAFCAVGVCQGGSLTKNFYRDSCPNAEEIIKNATLKHVTTNNQLPSKLLRMHFHDCFVRGCDASVLINSTASNTAEKDAIPNLSLSGFDVLEEIKAELEKKCPGIVSCADILSLAARDSFQKPMWEVRTGRRDGRVSLKSEVSTNIPSPFQNFTVLKQFFENKGLTVHDLVVLSGGHTIGIGHCNLFSNRLYNFTGKGDQDPSLNPAYAQFLKSKCRSLTDTTTTVEMDPNSSLDFDKNYFDILNQNKGLFQSDAALLTNKGARNIAKELTNQAKFFTEFAQSMERMGNIGVVTGSSGEIRKKCGIIN